MNLLDAAVRNNADWCEAMAQAHGIASRRSPDAWWSADPMPPYYPNVISLRREADADAILSGLPAAMPDGWGFKDSFRTLDLAPHGFAVLFDAEWIAREPGGDWPAAAAPVVAVEASDGLARWATAWGETDAPLFVPNLLADPRVQFLSVHHGSAIVAGLAAMRSAGVVGFSNAFGAPELVAACLARLDGGRTPIVGYEDAETAATLAPLGFRATGPLRIWAAAHAASG